MVTIRPMNVIVVVCNSLHLGFLGAYGNAWIETPNLDRLAAGFCSMIVSFWDLSRTTGKGMYDTFHLRPPTSAICRSVERVKGENEAHCRRPGPNRCRLVGQKH